MIEETHLNHALLTDRLEKSIVVLHPACSATQERNETALPQTGVAPYQLPLSSRIKSNLAIVTHRERREEQGFLLIVDRWLTVVDSFDGTFFSHDAVELIYYPYNPGLRVPVTLT